LCVSQEYIIIMTLTVGEHKEFKPFRAVGCFGEFQIIENLFESRIQGNGGGEGGGGKQRQLQIFLGCVKCKCYVLPHLKVLDRYFRFLLWC
jgi:hypothetical protein